MEIVLPLNPPCNIHFTLWMFLVLVIVSFLDQGLLQTLRVHQFPHVGSDTSSSNWSPVTTC
jgi:hypothetical protein